MARTKNSLLQPVGIRGPDGQVYEWDGTTDPLSQYMIARIASGYFGYVDDEGAWYIKRFQNGEFLFAAGPSNFKAAWARKESLTYLEYYEVF